MPVPGHDVEAYCLLCECRYEERSTTTIKVLPGLGDCIPVRRPMTSGNIPKSICRHGAQFLYLWVGLRDGLPDISALAPMW